MKNKPKFKILSILLVLAFGYVMFLISITLHFQRTPIEQLAKFPHPVIWNTRFISPYMLYNLNSNNSEKYQKAWLYFVVIPENMVASEIIFGWSDNKDLEKRILCYRYFNRTTTGYLNAKSPVSKKYHKMFINAWHAEQSGLGKFYIAEAICLSDIPIDSLNAKDELDKLYIKLAHSIRDPDKEKLEVFKRSLINENPKHKKACEMILDSLEFHRKLKSQYKQNMPLN